MDYRLSADYEYNVVNHLLRIPVDLLLIRTTINYYIVFEKHNCYWKEGTNHAFEDFGKSIPSLLAMLRQLANALAFGSWDREALARRLKGGKTTTPSGPWAPEEEIIRLKSDLHVGLTSLRSEYFGYLDLVDLSDRPWANMSLPDPVDAVGRLSGDLGSAFLPFAENRFSNEEVRRMFRSHWASEFFVL